MTITNRTNTEKYTIVGKRAPVVTRFELISGQWVQADSGKVSISDVRKMIGTLSRDGWRIS
jgi:hypothetical protein